MGLYASPKDFGGGQKMRADAIQGGFGNSKNSGGVDSGLILGGAAVLIVLLIGILFIGRIKKKAP